MNTRREFINNAGKAAVATGLVTLAGNTNTLAAMPAESKFIHHVYFWLKNPDSKEDKAKLVEGLKKMQKIKTIKMSHIGQPAKTNRDVVDHSYAISWFTIFDNAADEENYQHDPVHLKFIEECSSVWSKVVVYDSVDV
jgi:hypothetical protein